MSMVVCLHSASVMGSIVDSCGFVLRRLFFCSVRNSNNTNAVRVSDFQKVYRGKPHSSCPGYQCIDWFSQLRRYFLRFCTPGFYIVLAVSRPIGQSPYFYCIPPSHGTTARLSNHWRCRGLAREQRGSRNPVDEGSHKQEQRC